MKLGRIWKKIYNKYLNEDMPLDVRIFNIVVLVGIFSGVFSAFLSFLTEPSLLGTASIIALFIVLFLLFKIANDKKKYGIVAVIICAVTNLVFFPVLFYIKGGISGGITSWIIIGILYTFLIVSGKTCAVLVILETLNYAGMMWFSYIHPEFVSEYDTPVQQYVHAFQCIMITGVGIGIIIKYMIILYKKEKEKNIKQKELLEKAKSAAEEANKAKSDFLTNMSHEIRTPINIIMGISDIAAQKDLAPDVRENINAIRIASQNLLDIVNDILDFSKIESGLMQLEPENFDMHLLRMEIIAGANAKRTNKNIELIEEIAPGIPRYFYGDRSKIRQCVSNVLNNAVKYTYEGYVKIKTDYEINGDDVLLTSVISDTGIGIKPEDIERIFDNFNRVDLIKNRTVEGTGLGLAITKRLMDSLGGEISVESEYGKGTSFTMTFPMKIVTDEEIIKKLNENNIINDNISDDFLIPSANILVVDDNGMNLKVMRGLLKKFNPQVDFAPSGQKCIEKVMNKKYDLIFLDHMMPEMDGIETLHKLKEIEGFDTPVIALTANAIQGVEQLYLSEGFDKYLSKPVNLKQIRTCLECYFANEQ